MSDEMQFAPNSSINASINEMMPFFNDISQRRMAKAIRDAGKAATKQRDENTDSAARHVYREFIPAYLLNRCGYSLEYEAPIDGKTPDWLDRESKLLVEGYTFERYGTSPFPDRVISAVSSKCDKYESIATEHSLTMVITVYLDFISCIDLEDCYDNRKFFAPLFRDFPCLWSVLLFTEQNDGIPMGGQPYGFMCLTSDDTLKHSNKWHFPTFSVNR